MSERRWYCSFRVRHPRLPADKLASALSFKPDWAWTVGQPSTTPRGDRLKGYNKESYAVARFEPKAPDILLEDFLWQHSKRWEKHARFLAALARSGGRASYYVSNDFHGYIGFELPWPLLQRLGRLHIALEIDGTSSTTEQRRSWRRKREARISRGTRTPSRRPTS